MARLGLTREDLELALGFVGRVQGAADLDSYRREYHAAPSTTTRGR